ncbi:basic proline-rich protein-like [Panicum hallii]|uniref:basic proline-rich protein-like n=1 Tax=Panicum hallii TaxID=206008 RepID=UPI000DF4D4AB|nr:basic proline-rich protein-like [Panicum hallii]
MPEELVPVLNQVKELARGGPTSMMVLGDFLKRRITPLQQRTRMSRMYMGTNDCCSITRGPGTDFTRAELEVAIRGMTGETFSPESLVQPSGVKALCEDQALRSSVLASMPTLNEGGLAIRQLGGDPNHGIHIPGASPDRQQRASQGPGGPCPGGPAPAGKGKDKGPVPKHRHKDDVGAALTWRDDEAQGDAPAWSSQAEGSKSRRLQCGDGSFVGEPAPKLQKTAEAERQCRATPPRSQRQQPERRPKEARRPSSEPQIPPLPPTSQRSATPPPLAEPRPQTPPPPPTAPVAEDLHQRSGRSSGPNHVGDMTGPFLRTLRARPPGVAPAGGSGPQLIPSSSPAGRLATTPAGTPPVPAPVGPEPAAATPPRPEAAPLEEAAGPAATIETPAAAAAAALDAMAKLLPAESAAEKAAVAAEAAMLEAAEEPEAAAPEVAEVASTTTPPM